MSSQRPREEPPCFESNLDPPLEKRKRLGPRILFDPIEEFAIRDLSGPLKPYKHPTLIVGWNDFIVIARRSMR